MLQVIHRKPKLTSVSYWVFVSCYGITRVLNIIKVTLETHLSNDDDKMTIWTRPNVYRCGRGHNSQDSYDQKNIVSFIFNYLVDADI